jgi:hypothetical protein
MAQAALPLLLHPKPTETYDEDGITGPAIEIDDLNGDTMGRYAVGRVIARFPNRKAFVQNIIDSELGSAKDFPFGP